MVAGRRSTSPESGQSKQVDLYALLEISPDASQEVVRAAYRALARTFHPDVNASPEADLQIRKLNAAYAILGDPGNRAQYDLQRLRARRRPVPDRGQSSGPVRVSPRAAAPTTEMRATSSSRRASEPMRLRDQAILAIVVVAAVAAVVLALVWASAALDGEARGIHTSAVVRADVR